MSGIENLFVEEMAFFESHMKAYANERFPIPSPTGEWTRFHESIRYSLFSGGKRFRPLLAILTADTLGGAREQVVPLALAVEMIHTYSLIHDDLPCMDNDDFRRGQPTHHRKFGEDTALLAGDGLLTEAFRALATARTAKAEVVVECVRKLAEAAGASGMVGGQVLDIEALRKGRASREQLDQIHAFKTGALIAISVEGAAILLDAKAADLSRLQECGRAIGWAFQIADDIEDHDPKDPEGSSLPVLLGLEKTRSLLTEVTERALSSLIPFGDRAQGLRTLIQFNCDRVHGPTTR